MAIMNVCVWTQGGQANRFSRPMIKSGELTNGIGKPTKYFLFLVSA